MKQKLSEGKEHMLSDKTVAGRLCKDRRCSQMYLTSAYNLLQSIPGGNSALWVAFKQTISCHVLWTTIHDRLHIYTFYILCNNYCLRITIWLGQRKWIKHVVSDMSLCLCHRKTLVHHAVQCVLKTPLDPTVTVYQVKHVDKVSLLECDNMKSFYGETASYRQCV